MGFLKDIKEIKNKISEIEKDLDGTAKIKAAKLQEVENYLSKIEIKVKRIVEVPGVDGVTDIRIDYEVPSILLSFDINGNLFENSTFKAINMLNLISFEDMQKISNAIKFKKN